MKTELLRGSAGFAMLMILAGPLHAAAQNPDPPREWPRVVVRNGVTNTIYQPQLESWDYTTLKAKSAVAVQPRGEKRAVYGTVAVEARTRVDRAVRRVIFETIKVTEANFPSQTDQAVLYAQEVRSLVPTEVRSLSLDRLEASLGILEAREKTAGQPVRNDPPKILFSRGPAMLVPVDGSPVYKPVANTRLERVMNTRALLLRDQSGKYYLHLFDGFLDAPALDGPWVMSPTIPQDVKTAEQQAVAAKQVDLLAGQENPETKQKPSLLTADVPEIHIVTSPTELIVTVGEPKWVPIPTTMLLCATNTTAHLFKYLADQQNYVLISGRWFRAPSFGGPWEYVPGASLPGDFAKIPDDSLQENVKAAVPGTHQAQEAAIANSIPQTAKVDRKKAVMDPPPKYDGGKPKLAPIDGTPLHYVVNSPAAVIEVDEETWYACQNGVWFAAISPNGPWTPAATVPAVIYSIPPSSPMHYVTYVTVQMYNPNFIWVNTTPGYYGTVMSSDDVVVYGTGYTYPPYVSDSIYVAYPITYGYGCNPCWTPWAGWAFGFAAGWGMSAGWNWWCSCPPAPYWGPYRDWCYGAHYNAYGGATAWGPYRWAGTSGYIYHHNGPWTGVSRGAAGYNAWTGNEWASRYGHAYNSVTGARAIGQRGSVENVYTGNYASGGRGAAYNPRTGTYAAGRAATVGNEGYGRSATVAGGNVYNPNTDWDTHVSGIQGNQGGAVDVNGHVIAGRDGNYYRPDGAGGWQTLNRPLSTTGGAEGYRNFGAQQPAMANRDEEWNRYQPSAGEEQHSQSLNNEFNARQTGERRQQSFQMNRPAFSGGFRGGGGFRR